MKRTLLASALLATTLSATALAQDLDIIIHTVNEQGTASELGQIKVTETDYGLLFTPQLSELTPGIHGFHVHENADCGPKKDDAGKVVPGGAAGGHLDPKKTDQHLGPYDDDGHLGDLPALYVDEEGNAHYPVLAPKLKKLSDLKGHALMIHAGGDNHSDNPEPLGGGGARFACGVVK
ncbi:superoxide dismutase family protein [Oceanisphaera avium]|uniref:Superoxide dismutase [Cu-Zn] n=1 Tax=Oceanisphaera avium TaxID=1903694 RepID=A0A1Y0D052_9GAMM|nr:superoxide dismutase family protein [Oceanisphaera avium]ART80624.1 superoxide dismutase [Oceanisphaera avium]